MSKKKPETYVQWRRRILRARADIQRLAGGRHRKARNLSKGGRSVTLKNMASVTITRRGNGTVGIRGVKK